MLKIKRIYQRHYRDNGQTTVYVEWTNGSRTECPALKALTSLHFSSLIARAMSEGLNIEEEVW